MSTTTTPPPTLKTGKSSQPEERKFTLDPELIAIVPMRKRMGKVMRSLVKFWNKIAPVTLSIIVWIALLILMISFFVSGPIGWAVVFLILFILFTFTCGIVFGWKLVS